jgi:type II secretory pathway predicted ATPase ExeA
MGAWTARVVGCYAQAACALSTGHADNGEDEMYPEFFGFDKLPFRLRPDSEFLYAGSEYSGARANVLAGLESRGRPILLMGPAGVGKTLLLEDVLREIKSRFTLCRINQPHISATELLRALLLQLGVPSTDPAVGGKQLFVQLAATLNSVSSRMGAPLLIVDDAQLLAAGPMRAFAEMVRREPRLRLLLAGQNGQRNNVGELTARIVATDGPWQVHLHALAADEVKAYIDRRLAVAGARGKELFTPEACALVYQHTGGAPRLINVLCDAALHAACARSAGHVSGAEIVLATQDPRWPEAVARDRANSPAPAENPPPAAAQLFVSLGTQHIMSWPVKAGRISIGRAPDNEVRLDAVYISRHHCQVVTVGNVSTIEDLGSVNGIYLNGKIVRRHVLQHEDQIMLGEHMLTYLVSN